MSHESIAKMAKCSQKMIETIAKQVEDHFVPRNEFFQLSKSKIVGAKNHDKICHHPFVLYQSYGQHHKNHIKWN